MRPTNHDAANRQRPREARKLRYSQPMAEAPETERVPDGDRQQSLQSLERGMAVIQVFSRERPALTLSEVANLTGITRATARRILLTLEKLGHVRSDGRLFSPTPRLLTLGWAYLSSLNLSELALPLMETLVEETHESCSAATLDLPDVVYVARVPTRRIMSITLSVGTRLPAHCTSMGRVLLAALAPDELDRYLAGPPLEAWTERTTTDPDRLRARSPRRASAGGRWSTRSSRSACARWRRRSAAARTRSRHSTSPLPSRACRSTTCAGASSRRWCRRRTRSPTR